MVRYLNILCLMQEAKNCLGLSSGGLTAASSVFVAGGKILFWLLLGNSLLRLLCLVQEVKNYCGPVLGDTAGVSAECEGIISFDIVTAVASLLGASSRCVALFMATLSPILKRLSEINLDILTILAYFFWRGGGVTLTFSTFSI